MFTTVNVGGTTQVTGSGENVVPLLRVLIVEKVLPRAESGLLQTPLTRLACALVPQPGE